MSNSSPQSTSAEAASDPRRRFIEAAAIVLLALTLNLAGNGRVSLWDRDEPRYAGCVREMRARSDWVHPTFNGLPRYQKPILIYWLMRAGFAIGGDNPFGARLASSLAGAGTCLLVWSMGRRMLGPRAGLAAALMLATAPIMVAESKLATTDATLTLLVVGCQFCLWELGRRDDVRIAAGFWVCLALATLTKGPVGLGLIATASAVSWWWGGPTVCWRRLRWRWGIAGFVLMVAPWFVTVGVISHGEFYRVAVKQQLVDRLTTVMEQHGGFPGYYLASSLLAFYPWSTLLPAAVFAAYTRRRLEPNLGFLLGWIVGPMVLLECVRTKIFHYYVPSYPACALLAAWLVSTEMEREVSLRRLPLGRTSTGLLAGIGIGLTVLLVALGVVLPTRLLLPCLALAVVTASGTLYALDRLTKGATERAVAVLVATWAAFMLGLGGWLLPAAEPYRLSRFVGERLDALATARQAQPVMMSFQEPSVVYALGRPAPEIRTWEMLFDLLDRHGTVVAAVQSLEAKGLQSNPYINVEFCETLKGFNVVKWRPESVRFAVVRKESLSIRTARMENLLVK